MNANGVVITIIAVAVAILGTLYFTGRREMRRAAAERLRTIDEGTAAGINTTPTLTIAPLAEPQHSATPAQMEQAAAIVAIP